MTVDDLLRQSFEGSPVSDWWRARPWLLAWCNAWCGACLDTETPNDASSSSIDPEPIDRKHVDLEGIDLGAIVTTWPRFSEEALRWNARTNLYGSTEHLDEVLFADACVMAHALRHLALRRWADVGAGAGAPGIPLGTLLPQSHGILVEPRRKRVAFMRHAIGMLGLSLQVVEERLDVKRPDPVILGAAPVELVYARATFAPEAWLTLGAALAPHVMVLAAKPNAEDPSFQDALRSLAQCRQERGLPSLQLRQEHVYRLPCSGAPRSLSVWSEAVARPASSPQLTS